eukprot:g2863.t1
MNTYDPAMWHQGFDQYGRQCWINNHTGQATYHLHGAVGAPPSPQQYPMAYQAPSTMGMPPAGMVAGPSFQPMREVFDSKGNPGFYTDSSERTRSRLGAAQTVGLSLLLAAGKVRSSKSNRSKVLGFSYRR